MNNNIDFATEAIVAINITRNKQGSLVDLSADSPSDGMLHRFSLLKYGHLGSVRFFAHKLATTALNNTNFINFLQDSTSQNLTVFITSPGIYNVPSASNLLLREVSTLINSRLSKLGIPPLKVAEQTRLGESTLNYAERSVNDRTKDPATRSLIPEVFKDQAVVFVDDVYISGTVAERTKTRMLESGVAKLFFLFGMRVDPLIVKETDGKIEDYLNKFAIDGTLSGLKNVLDHEFVPTQKTVRDFLSPENRPQLIQFLTELKPQTILKMYLAAVQNGFRERWERIFSESVDILEEHLRSLNYLDDEGKIIAESSRSISKKKNTIPANKALTKLTVWHIDHLSDLPDGVANLYSKLKYSDPIATKKLAEIFAEKIWSDEKIRNKILSTNEVLLSSSAYGAVPTAAGILVEYISQNLRAKGVKASTFKIDWKGDFGVTNYGKMSPEERSKCLSGYETFITKENLAKIKNRFVLIIDDLSATGSHEKKIGKILDSTDVDSFAFCVLIDFSEQLAYESPETEEKLNHAAPIDLVSLADYYNLAEQEGLKVLLNTRTVRYILSQANEDEITYSNFLARISQKVIKNLYAQAVSYDNYHKISKFIKGIQILENFLSSKKIIDQKILNSRTNRTIGYEISLGKSMDKIGASYSRMKFGSVKDIQFYAKEISKKFIARLDDPSDTLLKKFQSIRDNREYAVMIIAGSRNVPSAAEFLYEEFLNIVNNELALRNLPTIIRIHPTRLEAISGEYAAMGLEHRKNLPSATNHILPGKELYQMGVHIFYADDVRITGATADGVEQSAVENGALSYSDIYAVTVDPAQAFSMPEIESKLNKVTIKGVLDDNIRDILNQEGFRPVQRLLRVILDENNRTKLGDFITDKVSLSSLHKIYTASLSNDYLKDPKYSQSVEIIGSFLHKKSTPTRGASSN